MNVSQAQDVRSHEMQATVRQLVERAVRGLPQMFNPRAGMFCYKLKKTASGLVQEGISARYTAMTLMGLHRLERSGASSPLNLKPILDSLLANTEWAANIGDLGLLLWLSAEVAPHRLDEIERRFSMSTALTDFADAREGITMHLAWFLTGLSYCALVSGNQEKTREVACKTFNRLIENQGQFGYFGHLATNHSLKGRLRGRIGSFADQVYPIYGMTQFWRAYGDNSALQRARQCAAALCEAQGPLGQWWWHYDCSNGQVAERYPVFSVHQHGMGPMVLSALGDAVQSDFSPWIYKGLQWIVDNELNINMQDDNAHVVWRCIERDRTRRYWNAVVNLATRQEDREAREGLHTLFECRPYELGWLLYAFADFESDSQA